MRHGNKFAEVSWSQEELTPIAYVSARPLHALYNEVGGMHPDKHRREAEVAIATAWVIRDCNRTLDGALGDSGEYDR
jgi:hypothetical protein